MPKLADIKSVVRAAAVMREVYKTSRCNCGGRGSWRHTVSGTIGGKPAIWMGCSNRGHSGQAVGGGLVGEGYHATLTIIAACDRLGIDIDEVMDSEIASRLSVTGDFVSGSLAVASEREVLSARIKAGWTEDRWFDGRSLAARGLDRDEIMVGT